MPDEIPTRVNRDVAAVAAERADELRQRREFRAMRGRALGAATDTPHVPMPFGRRLALWIASAAFWVIALALLARWLFPPHP